jgi:energy-coupling factor transport system permease protein
MLKAIHPLAKLAVCVFALSHSIIVFDARFQAMLYAVAFLALLIINRTRFLTLLALTVPFALLGCGFLTTSLLFRQESEFAAQMAGEALWHRQGFSAGIVLFLRALACGMISAFFALTTDPGTFVRSLMLQLKLPPRIGYSLFAAMQFVPDLAMEAQQMRFARAMKAGKSPRRIPSPPELASLIIPLLAYAIRRAGRTAIVMEARGLSPDGPRTILNAPRFRGRDAIFVVVGLGVISGCGLMIT